MTRPALLELQAKLRAARTAVPPSSVWEHLGTAGIYVVTGHAFDADTEEVAICYRALDAALYVDSTRSTYITFSRSLARFVEPRRFRQLSVTEATVEMRAAGRRNS